MITANIKHELIQFPVGELHVRLHPHDVGQNPDIIVTWTFTKSDDVVELLLFCDAVKRAGLILDTLQIPYVPFSRQDRINVPGETLSIAVMAQLINSLGARSVVIQDPHSDVTPALIDRCTVIQQHDIFHPMFPFGPQRFCLVSPDAGALKKIYKLAQFVRPLSVIECSKQRDVVTGEITGCYVPLIDLEKTTCVIVDDICDGGRTFVELAKKLRQLGASRIILCVTHGFFTKGLQVFDGLIDEIYTRTGRRK